MRVRSAPEVDEPLGLTGRRTTVRSRLNAEWLLDGAGFGWLRFAVDLIMLALAVAAAIAGARAANVSLDGEMALFAFPALVVCLLWLRGMYKQRLVTSVLDGIAPVVSSISVAAMVCIAVVAFSDPGARPAGLVARAWLFATVYVGAARILLVSSQRRARAHGLLGKPTVIIGAGRVGAHVARRLEEHPEYGLRPIGFLDADPPPNVDVVDRRAPVLGGAGRPRARGRAARRGARHPRVLARPRSDAGADRAPLRRAAPPGVARAAAVRGDQRARGARPSRRPAPARAASGRPEGLAVRDQARLRPPGLGAAVCCSSRPC